MPNFLGPVEMFILLFLIPHISTGPDCLCKIGHTVDMIKHTRGRCLTINIQYSLLPTRRVLKHDHNLVLMAFGYTVNCHVRQFISVS